MPAPLLCLLASPVLAAPVDDDALSAHEQQLEEALDAYVRGDLREARDALLRLVNDPSLEDAETLQTARVWLGEVHLYMGDRDAARSTYRTVLLYDRSLRLDPFQHPPDVVAFFDSVRAEVDSTSPPPRTQTSTLPPLSAYLWPGGVQLHNDRPVAAALTTVGVAASAGTVGGLTVYLVRQDMDGSTPGIQVTEPRDQTLSQLRAAQWTVAAAGMGLWLGTSVGGTVVAARPTWTPAGPGMAVRF